MHEDPLPLATTLRAAGEIAAAKVTDSLPIAEHEQADVLAALHDLDSTLTPVHDQLAECVGMVDSAGRCMECGRLVLVGAWRLSVHKEGGCMMAVPFVGTGVWLWHNREAVPFVGRRLWLRRQRRADPNMNGQHP